MTLFPQARAAESKRYLVWLAVALTALVLGLFCAPSLADEAADKAADKATAEAESTEIQVPKSPDRGMATMGGHAYRSYCASCHGPEAKGHGSIATMLSVQPADLTRLSAENGGEFPYVRTFQIIDGREKVKGHGTTDMPAWGDAFQEISGSDEEVEKRIHQLVHFLWTVQE